MTLLLLQGDARALPLRDGSVDAVVTDPPYGLGFMGKEWDTFNPAHLEQSKQRRMRKGTVWKSERWPAKNGRFGAPGGAPIDYDRSRSGLERFERWCEGWAQEALRVLKPGGHLVAFGGPRTYHRLVCGLENAGFEIRDCLMWLFGQGFPKSLNLPGGLGTALKPAWEPIILARKLPDGTVAQNIQKHGTGALRIDECRIPHDGSGTWGTINRSGRRGIYGEFRDEDGQTPGSHRNPAGRWPTNVVLDEAAVRRLDRESGGPSRFFYTAKASRSEREAGLEEMDAVRRTDGHEKDIDNPRLRTSERRNDHPTVKPVSLMRWLVRLVTPPGGLVLDPFVGSGSTTIACLYEGRNGIGLELESHYLEIARGRIARWTPSGDRVVNKGVIQGVLL